MLVAVGLIELVRLRLVGASKAFEIRCASGWKTDGGFWPWLKFNATSRVSCSQFFSLSP